MNEPQKVYLVYATHEAGSDQGVQYSHSYEEIVFASLVKRKADDFIKIAKRVNPRLEIKSVPLD